MLKINMLTAWSLGRPRLIRISRKLIKKLLILCKQWFYDGFSSDLEF